MASMPWRSLKGPYDGMNIVGRPFGSENVLPRGKKCPCHEAIRQLSDTFIEATKSSAGDLSKGRILLATVRRCP